METRFNFSKAVVSSFSDEIPNERVSRTTNKERMVLPNNIARKYSKYISAITVKNSAINKQEILDLNLQRSYIYLHRKADDKEIFYVGKGKNNRCMLANYRNQHWANIVNKHGYYIEIVESNLSEEDAFKLEIEYISKYGRLDKGTGILCNMTDGGEGSEGIKFTTEWKEWKSKMMTGENNHMYGKRFYGESNPNYGNKGANNNISKAVIALDFDGNFIKEYPSIVSTSEDGYSVSAVSECCLGNRAQTGNKQFIFKSDYNSNNEYKYKRGKTSVRAVVQSTYTDNSFVNYYPCMQDVAKDGFSPKVVQAVCSGKKKSHLGYKWYYIDDLDEESQAKIRDWCASKILSDLTRNSKNKVDALQLPPVREKISKTFLIDNKVELTEIARQEEGNPLLELFALLRDDVKNKTSNCINYLKTHKEGVNETGGFRVLNKEDFTNKMAEVFSDEKFAKDTDYVRYVAWTNDNIRSWNKYIRSKVVTDDKEIISIDDLFTGYTTICDEFFTPIITNSEDYIVVDLEKRVSEYGFTCFYVVLRNIYDGKQSTVTIADHTEVEGFKRYYNKLNALHYQACYCNAHERKKNWKHYYEFKNAYLTMATFPLGDNRATVSKDIDYGYGLTVHKSQGSTYENVFINLANIAYFNGDPKRPVIDIELRNKLLYVALSRTSKNAYIFMN